MKNQIFSKYKQITHVSTTSTQIDQHIDYYLLTRKVWKMWSSANDLIRMRWFEFIERGTYKSSSTTLVVELCLIFVDINMPRLHFRLWKAFIDTNVNFWYIIRWLGKTEMYMYRRQKTFKKFEFLPKLSYGQRNFFYISILVQMKSLDFWSTLTYWTILELYVSQIRYIFL